MPRRVEEVCFAGHSLLIHRVDVTVSIAGMGQEAFVPIGRFLKGKTRRERVVRVQDEEGRLVPALIPRERDCAVAAALAAAAAGLVDPQSKSMIDSLIADAVREPDDNRVSEVIRKLKAELDNHAREPADGLPTVTKDEIDMFLKLATTVAGQWLLLVPVCADGKSHQFTYEFLSPIDLGPDPEDEEERLLEVAARLGWWPTRIVMRMGGMVLSPVSHAIFEAPDGLSLVDAWVHRPTVEPTKGWGDATRQHVYVESEAPTGQPKVFIRLRPRRDGLVRNGFIVGLLISGLLLAGAVFHEQLKHATAQADAATALLLAVPSFFLLDAARSVEHRFIARTLWPIQFLLLTTGLAAFLAAILMLGSDDKKGPPLLPWQLLAGIACLGTLSLLIAYVGGDTLASLVARTLRKVQCRMLEFLEWPGPRRRTGDPEE
jgi:hypothetical protein